MKRALLVALALVPGCSSAPRNAAVAEGKVRAGDGVEIAFDVRGSGDPALVFIHCWCGNRAFWRNQLDEFARDHRVVAIDLAGHGASGRGRQDWTVAGLAGDVQAVIEGLDLPRVVLVGSSMGGPIALEVARRMPGRVAGVVGVDTLHDAEREMTREVAERIAGRFEADFEGSMRGFMGSMVHPETDAEVAEWIAAEACKTDHRAALALMRDFPNVNLKEMLARAGAPVRCINAAAQPDRAPETAVEANRKYADFDAVILEGTGHFPMLERPAEFNSALQDVVAGLPSR